MTYADAMVTAALDWSARLAPITTITPNGVVEIDTHRATHRSDTGAVLGVVGADDHPHQPADLLELARITLDAAPTHAHVEVVGSLRAGRTVFMTIAMPDDIDVAGDVHLPRLVWVTVDGRHHRHPRRVHLPPGGVRGHHPGQLPQRPHERQGRRAPMRSTARLGNDGEFSRGSALGRLATARERGDIRATYVSQVPCT